MWLMKSFFKKFLTFLSITLTLLLITISIYAVNLYDYAKDVKLNMSLPSENCKVYDNNGDEISNLGTTFFNYVPISEISDNVIKSFISIEDQDYYTHNGINYKRVISALKQNIFNQKIVSGASTITQQYIKNIYLTSEKTFDRKIKEIALAMKLDYNYTKEQILEAYLNNVLFGGRLYGISLASKYYFNKHPLDLTVYEAATLAGMVQLPNFYNPFNNPSETENRRNLVMKQMNLEGYITDLEYETYSAIDITTTLNKGSINSTSNYMSSYFDYLYSYLTNNYQVNFYDSDYKIYTHIDSNIQKEIYDIINNKYSQFTDPLLKCAIVVIDNKTNGVKAICGNTSTDEHVLNYALTKIQPGSTIKPILDYAPAIEYNNYTLSSIIDDEPYTYSNGSSIKNWDNQYLGPITLRKALSTSRNIPALKLFQEVGIEKAMKFASNLGLENNNAVYEAEAIGGSLEGYSLLSLTNAYTAFANLGKYADATPIKAYEKGLETYEIENTKKQVMRSSTAFLINETLHDVFKNTYFDIPKTYLMAKTGQTNYDDATLKKYNIPAGTTKDSLVIAYTKDLTIGIWVGYDVLVEGHYLNSETKQIPRSVMKILFEQFALSNQTYDMPSNIEKVKIYQDGYNIYLAKNEPNSYYEYFENGTAPLSYKPHNYLEL